jgi:hypothetical protein
MAGAAWRSGRDAGVGGVQDFADGAAQGGGAIRLLEIAGRRKLYAGSAGGFGIATGEENGQDRKATQESGGSGGPPMRHDDMGDGSLGLSVSQRRGACSPSEAPQDAIAEAHERLTNHFADGIVVFGDKDGLAAAETEGRRRLQGGTARRQRDVRGRKICGRGCPASVHVRRG